MNENIEIAKKNFFNTAIGDIYRVMSGNSIVAGFTLTFCLIDYLAWLEYGEYNRVKQNFSKWIEKRLLPLNIFYAQRGEELFSIRCGLVHTFGPSNDIQAGKYEGYHLLKCSPGMHLQSVNNNILKICLYTFITEIVYASHLFFEELKTNQSEEIINRLNKQIKNLEQGSIESYNKIHLGLAIFDNPNKISLHAIRSDYTVRILCGYDEDEMPLVLIPDHRY